MPQPMQWLFDIILEMMANAGYALKTWVLAQLCTSTCRIGLSSGYSLVPSVWTRILFDLEFWDVNSEFTDYGFYPKENGYYQVNLAAMGTGIAAGKRWNVAIKKNGGWHTVSWDYTAGNNLITSRVSDIVRLEIGDYLEFFAFHDAGPFPQNIFANEAYTFVSIHQLSKDWPV